MATYRAPQNYEVGGNDIDTKCNGESTNLHATWDTGMLETSLDASYGGSAQTYATALVSRIKVRRVTTVTIAR
jgi:hypothetical protein